MPQLYGIQVLRALAALMVAIHHVQADAAFLAARAGTDFTPSRALPWTAGVDLFFVISGFIMVHSSAGLFDRPDGARLFVARRIARIVPLYWAATTLFLAVLLASPALVNSGTPSPAQIAASYLFWPMANAAGEWQPIYSLGWTLNYEMLFYALFGAALLAPGRLVVPLVCAALAGLVAAQALSGPLPLPFGFWGQPIVLEFAAGMAVGLLRRKGLRLDGRLRWLMAAAGIALFVIASGDGWARPPGAPSRCAGRRRCCWSRRRPAAATSPRLLPLCARSRSSAMRPMRSTSSTPSRCGRCARSSRGPRRARPGSSSSWRWWPPCSRPSRSTAGSNGR